MVLTVHHLENSQSLRVVWLLEEIGSNAVEYEIKLYRRDPVTSMAPPELKAISPLGTSPAVTDETGTALSETNAIIDYILDQVADSNQLRPRHGDSARADYLFIFHGAQGSLMPSIFSDVVWKEVVKNVPCPLSYVMKVIYEKVNETVMAPRISKFLELCEEKLSGRDFVAADHLTAADITLIYPMEQALEDNALKVKFPRCKAWLERMHEREAHKTAMDKVGEK